jgi:hypothetical protein
VRPIEQHPDQLREPIGIARALLTLSGLRQAFVREYVDGGCKNAKAAAIRAGYSEGTASSNAHKLLEDPVIAAAVAEVKAGRMLVLAAPMAPEVKALPLAARASTIADPSTIAADPPRPTGVVIPGQLVGVRQVVGVDIPNVVLGIARVAFADPRRLFNDDGAPIPIHDLDDDTALAIESVEVVEQYQGSGEYRVFTGYIKKYRFSPGSSAQDMLKKRP